MIYDQSSNISGVSCQRLSKYLSLCKIDILVRNREKSRPLRRVDQPGKAGQARTITETSNQARLPVYRTYIDYSIRLGNREFTLRLKSEMSKQMKLVISNLTEAGSVILQKDNMDLARYSLYRVNGKSDNFANSREVKWSCCLVVNKNQQWVNSLAKQISKDRLQVDYIIIINQGVIGYCKVPSV